jgi:hypothetical protein
VGISGKFGETLAREWKITLPGLKTKRYNHVRVDDTFAYFPVKSVAAVKLSGQVFNLQVAKSNTFCVPCVVHNCEKDALSQVLYRVTSKFHIPLIVNRGYSSCSAMYSAYERFKTQIDDRPVVILYMGDHDPSGLDMVRDITERMQEFGLDFQAIDGLQAGEFGVAHVGLTPEQVAQYNPPPNPAKIKDPRAKNYILKYGNTSWELDALPPKVLGELITGWIEGLIDPDIYQAALDAEKSDKVKLNDFIRSVK